MIKDFLIISCTGNNDKIGLKINNNFFVHNFKNKTHKNELLVSTILNLTTKHKANIATMCLSRNQVGDRALTVLNLDDHLDQSAREELLAYESIHSAKLVTL